MAYKRRSYKRREGTMVVITPGDKIRQVASGVYKRGGETINNTVIREEKGQ